MTGMGPNPPVPDAVAPAIDRHYLLERVGDAAVVQLYADGFVDLLGDTDVPLDGARTHVSLLGRVRGKR